MDPRIARMKLRKLGHEGKFDYKPKQRWEWSEEKAKEIEELLKC